MSTSVDTVYCEGWDPRRREVVGRLTAATARERDRSGAQYAVALVDPKRVVALLEIAWAHHFARCWYFDELGRRTAVDEFRVLGGRLFHLRSAEWAYQEPEQPEFDEQRAHHVETRYSPDGTVSRSTAPNGMAGPRRESTVLAPVDDRYSAVPAFEDWGPLLRLDVELVASPDPAADEVVDPPWRPVTPMQPEAVDELFRPDVRWRLPQSDDVVVTEVHDAGVVRLPSGRLVVADPGWLSADTEPLLTAVPPGDYRVELAVVRFVDDPAHRRVAAARLVVSTEPVTSWDLALKAGQEPRLLGDDQFYGFGVDAGMGCFVDASVLGSMEGFLAENYEDTLVDMPGGGSVEVREPESGATLVAFHSGWGDGAYPTWVGRTAHGEVACFVADLLVLRDAVVAREEQAD